MPNPQFGLATSPGRVIARFGNNALPNGQGTMAWYDLNDTVQWFMKDVQVADAHQIAIAQYAWQGEGVDISDDFGSRIIKITSEYEEAGGSQVPISGAKATLLMAGSQYLTFDNVTQIPAKCRTFGPPVMIRRTANFRYAVNLEFICKGWAADQSATTIAATALNSGSVTAISQTYAGSVFCRPVWTLTIPNSNAVAISSFVLANAMSGETLTLNFSGNLAASTAWTITIDSGAQTVVDQHGTAYDFSGAFPRLYGPAGQVQTINSTLTPASGTATGCTIGASFNARWTL